METDGAALEVHNILLCKNIMHMLTVVFIIVKTVDSRSNSTNNRSTVFVFNNIRASRSCLLFS